MANFIALVHAVLKENNIDTSDMSMDEKVKKFNELSSVENLKKEEQKNHGNKNKQKDLTNEQNSGTMREAKIVEEAAQIAVEGGIAKQANYRGISVKTANIINKTLAERKIEYPSMGEFAFVGSSEAHNKLIETAVKQYALAELLKINPSLATDQKMLEIGAEIFLTTEMRNYDIPHVARFISGNYGYRGISVNTNKIDDIAEHVYNAKIGYHPIGTGSIKAIIDHEIGHAMAQTLGLENNLEMDKMYKDAKRHNAINSGLSKFADEDIGEFIAEGFAEYKNNPNPRGLASKIGTIIDKENAKWIKMNINN